MGFQYPPTEIAQVLLQSRFCDRRKLLWKTTAGSGDLLSWKRLKIADGSEFVTSIPYLWLTVTVRVCTDSPSLLRNVYIQD